MAIPYSLEDLEGIKSDVLLPLNCEFCGKIFSRKTKDIRNAVKNNNGRQKFCTTQCSHSSQRRSFISKCVQCHETILKEMSQFRKSKSGNIFCNSSCAAIYNNTHKTKGNRKSKLEIWLEEQLPKLYPKLEIHFNRKDAIGSELDIYIPSIKLAFELNGIFHYEPIYGQEKFDQIQANDVKKSLACIEKDIELHAIDTSKQLRFTESGSNKYLSDIVNIINESL